MTQDEVAELGEADGFDAAVARALALADSEARQLGHDRVGTEHLLLGLLTNGSGASKLLTDAGVTLTAARSKVSEAVGDRSGGDRRGAKNPLPRTPRASRALGRAARFAHAGGSELVTSHHLLRAVLDVEGIAGQVLRGLGLDVESLRASLDSSAEAASRRVEPPRPVPDVVPPASCPSCNTSLEHGLAYRRVTARDEEGRSRDALILSCRACGQFLGAGSA